MIRSKYMENNQPTIYVVSTPIGNLNEINTRMIEVLNKVDSIFCEDTRVTSKLLNYLKITGKKLVSYHLHNEYKKVDEVLECARAQGEIALVSDAGYPLLSDPGETLINSAIKQDINVVVINGSNALIPALINSGFKTLPFTFIGFLPNKKNDAMEVLEQYKDYKHTIVLYESIHRLSKTLKSILDVFGDVSISISREITKMNEEHINGKVGELLSEQLELKGELVIVIDNSLVVDETIKISDEFVVEQVYKLIDSGKGKKDSIKLISKQYGLSKNYVYDLIHNK